MSDKNDCQLVTLTNGVIKFAKNPWNSKPCYTFYSTGSYSSESNENIVLYKIQFAKLLTCLQILFQSVVTQALEAYSCYNKMSAEEKEVKCGEDEEVLDIQKLAEWNHTGYVPKRIILKTSIYRGRLRMWVMLQWYKRPEYEKGYKPNPKQEFKHVDSILDETQWRTCKNPFPFAPIEKELKALLDFQVRCKGVIEDVEVNGGGASASGGGEKRSAPSSPAVVHKRKRVQEQEEEAEEAEEAEQPEEPEEPEEPETYSQAQE